MKESKSQRFLRLFKRDWQLHACLLIPVIYVFVWSYIPMYGVQIAFRDYNPWEGVWRSEWVGLQWFREILASYNFKKLFTNTVVLSLYSMIAGFPLPIVFALVMNALKNKKYGKVVSVITYLPNFISTTVLVGIIMMVLSPVVGFYGNIYRLFNPGEYPYDFRATEAAFRHLYVWSGVWKGFGWGSLLYTAALSGVSEELHEAAMIDGASRFRRIFYIDIPAILPTIAITLIMRMGSLIGASAELVLQLQTDLNIDVSEVLDTYIYNFGLSNVGNFSYAAAMNMFTNVINVAFMLIVNFIVKKMTEGEVALW